MGDRIEVGDRADHQDRHAAIEEAERVRRIVEEEDVAEAEHQARHGERQQRQQLANRPPGPEARRLLDRVGAGEDDGGAEHGGERRQHQRVAVARPAAAIHVVEVVVLQRRRQVVGPERRERREHRHRQDDENGERDHRTDGEEGEVDGAVRLRDQRHGTRRQEGRLPPLHDAVADEGEHRRQQQHDADDRAHLEVLLADDLLVDVGGEHVELPADHLRHAEVGDDEGEHDEDRADQPVAGTGQRHREEDPSLRGAQRLGRLVEPRVGDRQRRRQDDEGVRKGPEHLADDDADRPVDGSAHQPALEQALVSEQVDEADRRQQRRRQDRDLRHRLEDTAARHAGARQPVGEDEGERHADDGRQRRDPQAVEEVAGERRVAEVGGEVGEADEGAVVVLDRLAEQGRERQHDEDDERDDDRQHEQAQGDVVSRQPRPDRARRRAGRGREGGGKRGVGAHARGLSDRPPADLETP